MTNEQAIKYLQESKCNQKQGHEHQEIHDTALELAIQALEKQIAVEPDWEGGYSFYDDDAKAYCPDCGYYLKDDHSYCPDCGQEILWP